MTLLGGDAWSSPFLFQKGGPPGEAYYVELCSPAPEFERRYEETAGQEPPGCRAVLAYDAVRVIAAGLRSLGRLPDGALGASLRRDAAAPARRRRRQRGRRGHGADPLRRARRPAAGRGALRGGESPLGPPRPVVRGWLGEP